MRAHTATVAIPWFLLVACGAPDDASSPAAAGERPSTALQLPAVANPTAQDHVRSIPVCPGPAAPGDARCHSLVVVDASGTPAATSTPRGYGPADLYSAYNLSLATGPQWTWNATTGASADAPAWSWNGQTIAIVDAYDHPYAENDVNVYRAQYGLPPCTSASGCFRKIDQKGGTKYPRANCGWAQEISLDLDMASAICPSCKILLVEAASNSFANLGAAVNQARAQGATAISNSYGGGEFSTELSYAGYYNHAGAIITASSGDAGYGVEVPAAYGTVVAVGGTSLTRDGSGAWGETAWSGAGSGCSKYVAKPSWQKDAGCANRTVADVAAVADPATGVAVYDSYRCQGAQGWLVFGGTSVSSPIIAALYALAGNAGSVGPGSLYANASSLDDVTSGTNGSCGGSYLCTAGSGYDGPTGLGTPNGTTAF